MTQEGQRQDQKAGEEEDEHRTLPAPEVPGHRDGDEYQGGRRDHDVWADAKVGRREPHADELGADGEEVQQEQVTDREPAPKATEPFDDQLGVTDPGHRPEADHHLLVDDQDGDQQDQGPEQRVAEVLPGLRVRGDTAGVVVADHDDEARTDDGREREQPAPPGAAGGQVPEADGSKSAVDVTDVGFIENRRGKGRVGVVSHRPLLGHLGSDPAARFDPCAPVLRDKRLDEVVD